MRAREWGLQPYKVAGFVACEWAYAVGIPQPLAVASFAASVPVVARTLGSKDLADFWICSLQFLLRLSAAFPLSSLSSPPSLAFGLLVYSSLLLLPLLFSHTAQLPLVALVASLSRLYLATPTLSSVEALPILQLCTQLVSVLFLRFGQPIAQAPFFFRCQAADLLVSLED